MKTWLTAAAFACSVVTSTMACKKENPPSGTKPTSSAGAATSGTPNFGVTEDEVLLGQAAAFTGPLAPRVIDAWRGETAAFSDANDAGGVHGRKVKLVLADDAYETEKARAAVVKLVEGEHVFALFGGLGTSMLAQTLPVLAAYHAENGLFGFSYLSGSVVLSQKPGFDVYFTTKSTNDKEAAAEVDYFVAARKKRFGAFFRSPSFAFPTYERVLKAKGLEFVLVRSFPASQTWEASTAADVEAFRKAGVDAIIASGPNQPCAALVRDIRKTGWKIPVTMFSFSDPDQTLRLLSEEQEKLTEDLLTNVIVTTTVPPYTDENLPIVKEYRRAIDKYKPTSPSGMGHAGFKPSSPYSFDSLEGYINARMFLRVLEKNGRELTRKTFYEAAESMGKFDIGLGVHTEFSKARHQAMEEVWLYYLTREGWKPVVAGSAALK